MATLAGNTRSKLNMIHDARLALTRNELTLNVAAKNGMDRVDAIFIQTATQLAAVIETSPHDPGRVTAALDGLQANKHVWREAIVLSCYQPPQPPQPPQLPEDT